MYIVQFYRKDGDIEEYFYHHLTDASAHFECFIDDDSELYNTICISCDETGETIRTLNF